MTLPGEGEARSAVAALRPARLDECLRQWRQDAGQGCPLGLEQGGDEAILEIPGIGRKVLSDVKRALRARGYELPAAKEEAAQ